MHLPNPAIPAHPATPLSSFLIAGFEGADHRNSSGDPVAMLDATAHATAFAQNYARLRSVGIRTVRESIGWSRAERDRRFDFASALRRAEAARKAGIGVIWTLWHYGLPADLQLFDAHLADRFADFAHAAARALHDPSIATPIFSPVNEISFLAWAACESALIHPHRGTPGPAASVRGFELKQRLVRAALAGCDAIRAAIPDARMLHVDPLVHIVAPAQDPSRADAAAQTRGFQFQAWDMLTGRLCPELGGAAHHVDYVGINYYHGNQFEIDTERRLHWHLRDPRRVPFRTLLHETFARYARPLLIAETSHFGVARDRWLIEIAHEVRGAMQQGIPIAGLCAYPIIDRPDWERPAHWHRSGLWDRCIARDGTPFDRLQLPYLRALRHAQALFGDDARSDRKGAPFGAYALVVFAATDLAGMAWRQRAVIESLAAHWTIVVVEQGGGPMAPRPRDASGRIIVLAPKIPPSDDDAHDEGAAATVEDVLAALAREGVDRYAAWLHTPMALPFVTHLAPEVVAYTLGEVAAEGLRTDARFATRHEALLRMAAIVGEVSRTQIERALRRPPPVTAQAMWGERTKHGATRRRAAPSERAPSAECVIVGAGIAGLCAAAHYGAGSLLLERDAVPGGSRRSVADHGFLFDVASHVLDGRDQFDALYARVLGDNVQWRMPRVHRRDGAWHRTAPLAPFFAAFDGAGGPVGYPRYGGTQSLIDGFVPLLDGAFMPGAEVVRILPHERCVELDDRRRVRYERLIVTLALQTLLAMCGEAVPLDVADAAGRLRTLSLRSMNIGVRGAAPPDTDWLFDVPGAIFDRAYVHTNVAPSASRAGHFALVCEIVHAPSRPLTLHGSALVHRCVGDCVAAGLIESREAVLVTHEAELPFACVIDDDPAHANLRRVERWLDAQGVAFTGSRGEWERGHCASLLRSARRAAQAARRPLAGRRIANAAR